MFNFFTAIFLLLELLLGVLLCFFGARFIRKIIAFAGAFAGFFLALVIAVPLGGVVVGLIAAVIAAVVVGALAYFFYIVGIYVMGASAGVSAASLLCSLLGLAQHSVLHIALMIGLAIVGIVLVAKFRRVFMAISTAISGGVHISNAIFSAVGAGAFAIGGALEEAVTWIGDHGVPAIQGMSATGAIITLIAAVAGIVVQLAITAKNT